MKKINLFYYIFIGLIITTLFIYASSIQANETRQAQVKVFEKSEVIADDSPIPLRILPKDKKGIIDWDGAVKEGYIKPLGILYPEISDDKDNVPFKLDVLIKSDRGTPSGVVFSHQIHTYWFDCKGCHVSIYKKKKDANREMMTMEMMKKGESCGKCHTLVAFSMDNCGRCHEDRDISKLGD